MLHICRRNRFALVIALLCVTALPALAQQLYDNWNPAACGVTDVATLTIGRPARLQRIDIWYRWGLNETTVGYTASLGSEVIANGELSRAECDPYQATVCSPRASRACRF